MAGKRTAMDLLDGEFLEVRHRIIDLAAAMDRWRSADGAAELAKDSRLEQIQAAIQLLAEDGNNNAERVQMIFSDRYDETWRNPS